jgi:hypothetical protein
MSNSLGEAVLDIAGDTSKLDASLEGVKGRVPQILGGLSRVGGALFAAGLTAAVAGVVMLGKGLFDSVQEAAKAQAVQAQLNAVLESTGGVAGVTAAQVNEIGTALSQMTMFDDEAIVSAESLLLTFTNIGANVFPQATETVLNMSQALGQDLNSSATQLGKALQDPILGITALRRVGVNFTDAQQEMIKGLVEAGKLEEAQALILGELETEFGGAAKAAGQTFAGQLKILQTQFGNIKETVGTALLPTLSGLATMLNDYLSKPETQAAIKALAESFADFAKNAAEQLPIVLANIKLAFEWLMNNKGVIVGVLAAIGVAIAAFVYVTVIPAALAALSALAPIILIMALVAGAAYLVYTAWTQNWGGIQTKLTALWAQLQPVFLALKQWLEVNIPIALAALANFWTTVLLPAIQAVWSWMSSTLFPFLSAVGNLIGTVIGLAVRILAGLWVNVLWPALKKVIDWIETKLVPVLEPLGIFIKEVFVKAMEALKKIIDGVTTAIKKLTDALGTVELPDWLTPGSPTPFEMGLRGIHKALSDINRMSLPKFASNLQFSPAMDSMMAAGSPAGGSYGDNYQIYLHGLKMENAGPATTMSEIMAFLNNRQQ